VLRIRRTRKLFGNRRSGFTLVELVIVGALIALFSSLAIFGVQQQFRSNTRKAVIGETRNIAAALEFANLDTTVFPKLCWLTESREGLDFLENQIGINPFFSVDVSNRTDVSQLSFVSNVRDNWEGPYFALSQTRSGLAQGRGGFVYMLLEDLPASGPNDLSSPGGLRWPSDPYNNPYVVYMLNLEDEFNPNSGLIFVTQDPDTQRANAKGNYVNAVVSYGPNHFPGGEEFEAGAPFGPVAGQPIDAEGQGPWSMRLYTGVQDFRPETKGIITYRYRPASEFSSERANVWSRNFGTANLPPSGIGISDPGADDVVFEF